MSTSSFTGLQLVSLIVNDYDEALSFFVGKLGFELVEDSPAVTSHTAKPKRWVVVRPPGNPHGTAILLARAEGESQQSMIGQQWAGRVGLFWKVEDFDATYERLKRVGVRLVGEPRAETYGRVVIFYDVSDNKWDLIGPAPSSQA
jgi:catechol 2,3-dioxygenase-like lactoylglutathione lyase family enzyme